MKRILVVAAHPDDEVLGCGGAMARLTKEGHEVFALILGEGATSRDETRNPVKSKKAVGQLKKDARKAGAILGIKDIFIHDFPDNRFDGVELLDIIKVIEKVKSEVSPVVIFTHYRNDLNVDHQMTYKAVITASRPVPKEPVREIYSFAVASSTEWNYPADFSPEVFFDITKTVDLKIKAMEAYRSELKSYPHPRSLEGIRVRARCAGMEAGCDYAESFKIVRMLR